MDELECFLFYAICKFIQHLVPGEAISFIALVEMKEMKKIYLIYTHIKIKQMISSVFPELPF